MSATFDVIPVIEQGLDGLQDTHEVQLALTPNAQALLLRALSRSVLVSFAKGVPMLSDILAAGAIRIDEYQHAALERVLANLGDSWASFTVSPDEATRFGNAVLDAADHPGDCADCGHLIDTDTAGTSCARCTETPRGRRAS